MGGISDTTPVVKVIFSLHVLIAGLAFILLVVATSLVITRIKNGRIRSPIAKHNTSDDSSLLKSSLATYFFLIQGLFYLCVAYAVLSAIVALQAKAIAPVSVTTPYTYYYNETNPAGSPSDINYGQVTSILSFVNQLASILFTVCLTGAVWLHSTNLTTNGTGAAAPSVQSKIWNTFILTAMLGWGLAAWSRGLWVRGSGQTASSFSKAISNDRATQSLYIAFRCWAIFSSTSVSIQVIKDYLNLKKNGTPGNTDRNILRRFVFVVVPLIWLRNAFILVNIILLFVAVTTWSSATAEVVAFLLIVFGQVANMSIASMILWGSWSMGSSAGTGPE